MPILNRFKSGDPKKEQPKRLDTYEKSARIQHQPIHHSNPKQMWIQELNKVKEKKKWFKSAPDGVCCLLSGRQHTCSMSTSFRMERIVWKIGLWYANFPLQVRRRSSKT